MYFAQHPKSKRVDCVILLWLVVAVHCAAAATEREERFIGWQGEVDSHTLKTNDLQDSARHSWLELISWRPRAYVFHSFLTHQECDHLISLAEPKIARSYVVDSKTGASKQDEVRTSYGAALSLGEDEIVARIEAKIAEWTHLPPAHGEPIQVLRYVNGQKYDAHWDWFDDPQHKDPSVSNRIATVLLYLSGAEEGGETSLPLADPILPSRWNTTGLSECARRDGIAVRPQKGDALLFWDMDLGGSKGDRRALHASCPTTRGTKWTATKWIHNKVYSGEFNPLAAGAVCKDSDKRCADFAALHMCDTDPAMVGPAGKCRKTCRDCIKCPAGDVLCMRRNIKGRRTTGR